MRATWAGYLTRYVRSLRKFTQITLKGIVISLVVFPHVHNVHDDKINAINGLLSHFVPQKEKEGEELITRAKRHVLRSTPGKRRMRFAWPI